jgi:hypothetical protein
MADGKKRAEERRWTAEKRRLFLEALAETCCVTRAAEAADMARSHCYALKLRDPLFAAQWEEAIAVGYAQVEERLILDAMGRGLPGGPAGAGATMDKYEREQALNLLKWHREEAVIRPRRRGGPPLALAAEDETDSAILKKLASVRRRLGR